MFIVLLKFSKNKSQASEFMPGHNDWVKRGFSDGVFLMAGSLKPGLGGVVLANNTNMEDLKNRVTEDPFVKEDVVTAEILEITPHQADEPLKFLLEN